MSFYILIDITILLLVLKAASEEHSVIKMLYGDIDFCLPTPGGRLNKKDGLTRYGNSHVKDKTS